jgi:glutamate-1-semialdehyde 2,1-aminomutase
LASQTFSKSITQYPFGAAPLFIEKARGSVAVDIDGNKYIDLVASLGAVTIGYAVRSQNRAIIKQISKGSIFSLPSTIEYEVAELLSYAVPSAEKVRFSKNGTDATSGAIRLARAYTGKSHVIACGYHGWQDWYVAGTSKNRGIPKILSSLIHNVTYGNLEDVKNKFESLNADVAAMIIEPISNQIPNENYIKNLRDYCSEKGVILIFDETVTGFRVSTGGAQHLLGVTPDLSCFGKGIANGYPLAALVGKTDIMNLMSEVFLSGTFGGDTVALSAGKYTIKRYL